jgi:hypothetical protein
MTSTQFLCIKKLIGKTIIKVAARHNLREIAAERGADRRIDAARIGSNRILQGSTTAAGVARSAQVLIDQAGLRTIRKDAVRALEFVFSLPAELSIDRDGFFNEAVLWVERTFNAPILSVVVHNDEAAPHCHVLLLPLVNGRLTGSALMGGPAKLKALQSDFYEHVGKPHGLTHKQEPTRPDLATRQAALNDAYAVLEANSGLPPEVLQALLAKHLDNPEVILQAVKLFMPQPTAKPKPRPKSRQTFVGIMTKPTKPDSKQKPIGFRSARPHAADNSFAQSDNATFDALSTTGKTQSLSCVGFGDLPRHEASENGGVPADAAEGMPRPAQGDEEARRDDPGMESDNREHAHTTAPVNAAPLSAPLPSREQRRRRASSSGVDRQQMDDTMRWIGRLRARHKDHHGLCCRSTPLYPVVMPLQHKASRIIVGQPVKLQSGKKREIAG